MTGSKEEKTDRVVLGITTTRGVYCPICDEEFEDGDGVCGHIEPARVAEFDDVIVPPKAA